MRVPRFLLPLTQLIADALNRLFLRLAHRETVGPLTVYWAPDADQARLSPRLRDALSLIQRFDQYAWDNLQAHASTIVVGGLDRNEAWPRSRMLQVKLALVEEHPAISIAVVLVGLGSRAAQSGGMPRKVGTEVERHVLSEQLHFIRRLQAEEYNGADQLLDWLRDQQKQLGGVVDPLS